MLLDQATPRNVSRALREINSFEWGGDFKPMARQDFLKEPLEKRLQEEMAEYLGVSRYEHAQDRADYRNGHYVRHLLTEMGNISFEYRAAVRESFPQSFLRATPPRRCRSVDKVLSTCFCLGLSTRKAAQVLAPVLEEKVSASTISRIARDLDHQVSRYHDRALEDQYQYLFFDGVVLKEPEGAVAGTKEDLTLCLRHYSKSRHEIIDFYPAASESEACWKTFLNDLYQRGLKGNRCELIATDGGTGLHAALQIVYPKIVLQRCWAHKTRNVLDKVKKKDQLMVKKALNRVSHAANRREAIQAYWRLSSRWRKTYPRAVACFKERSRSAPELLSDQKFSTVEPVKNHQLNRKSVS